VENEVNKPYPTTKEAWIKQRGGLGDKSLIPQKIVWKKSQKPKTTPLIKK